MVMRHAKVDPLKTPTIELSPEDIRSLTNRISVNPTDTGTAGYLLGQLVAPSATALDQGDFLFHLHIAAARSALPLMARFCHLDRKSVVSGKSVSVRVDLGGRRILKKKKQ